MKTGSRLVRPSKRGLDRVLLGGIAHNLVVERGLVGLERSTHF
jgi:hypothetical protein